MKNLKNGLIALAVMVFVSVNTQAFAEGIGFIDYKKVQDNFSYAQSASKEIDNKGLELQQFLVDKEKQYKSLDTPLKKQNFE